MKRKIRGSAGKSAYEIARDKAEAGEDDDDGKQMPLLHIVFCSNLEPRCYQSVYDYQSVHECFQGGFRSPADLAKICNL